MTDTALENIEESRKRDGEVDQTSGGEMKRKKKKVHLSASLIKIIRWKAEMISHGGQCQMQSRACLMANLRW